MDAVVFCSVHRQFCERYQITTTHNNINPSGPHFAPRLKTEATLAEIRRGFVDTNSTDKSAPDLRDISMFIPKRKSRY